MLTDTKLKNLKPATKAYKVPDRDGMYATVLPTGTISFRYNYRVNGRSETLVIGRYGAGGLSLQEARERLEQAKKAQSEGKSPSRLKAKSRTQLAAGEPFSVWAERWLLKYKMAESTRDMRRAVYERDLKRPFGSLLLHEITHNELRSVCDAILARGAPATAVHARDIVKLVFKYAEQRGQKVENPADLVAPSSIAVFEPRDRALGAEEIALFYEHIDYVQCAPTLRLACKLLLLTMVRKSELTDATWSEVNFTDALWTIPARRTAQPVPADVLLDMPMSIPRRAYPCSAAYIQQQMSFIRVFASWIGKPGLVRSAESYVSDPALVRRSYGALIDKGCASQLFNAMRMRRLPDHRRRISQSRAVLRAVRQFTGEGYAARCLDVEAASRCSW